MTVSLSRRRERREAGRVTRRAGAQRRTALPAVAASGNTSSNEKMSRSFSPESASGRRSVSQDVSSDVRLSMTRNARAWRAGMVTTGAAVNPSEMAWRVNGYAVLRCAPALRVTRPARCGTVHLGAKVGTPTETPSAAACGSCGGAVWQFVRPVTRRVGNTNRYRERDTRHTAATGSGLSGYLRLRRPRFSWTPPRKACPVRAGFGFAKLSASSSASASSSEMSAGQP